VKKVLVTPQGAYFVKDLSIEHQSSEIEYIYSNGIISNKKELINLVSDCDGLIIGSELIDKEVIDSAKNLKVVVRFGTTTENIDSDYLKKKNIALFKIKSEYTVKNVAKLCLAFSFTYIFNIQKHYFDSKRGLWNRYLNADLNEIKVGLIGAGDISREFLDLGLKLGIKFFYHSRKENPYFKSKKVRFIPKLEDLIKASNIISIHLPSNETTKKLFNKKLLSLMSGKALINTSRADIVCQQSLENVLDINEHFFYFCDVLGKEPPEERDLSLIARSNVYSTAHIGGYSKEALVDVSKKAHSFINKIL
tara:strand:- start:6039 stop:6959 length:921 start_codon:yes stop_codon:yes gene_type:complete